MHAKSLIVALALASSVVEANRPRMYIPRQVKREVENNAPVPENQPAPVVEKREPADFFKSLMDKDSRQQASNGDGVNFDPTLPLGFKRPGPSASAPALIIQPTTSSAPTTEPAVSTDAPTEADTGILLAPSGIVTSKTSSQPAQPVKTTAAAVKEPSSEAPKKEETQPNPVETQSVAQPAVSSGVNDKPATTEKPKEETKPAATTAPVVKDPSSANTPEKKPVETVTEPAVVETKTEKPSATKGLLDPVESILTSVLPAASEPKKETQPAPVETKTEEPAVETTEKPKTEPEETKPAAAPTTKEGLLDPVETIASSVAAPAESKTTAPKPSNTGSKKETQPAPVETETAKPADSKTTSPAVEKPAPTTKEGVLDPVETLLSSVFAEPADNKTKDPTPDQTESISQPEETGTPTKEPQRDNSKPQTDGKTLPTFSPPSEQTTAAPTAGETSKDGILDPVETLLSSVLPNQPENKTTSPEESSAPVDSNPTSAAPNGSEQTASEAPSTEPETTSPIEILPTSILPTNILPVPTDVTSAVPEPSSPVTVSPVIPTTVPRPEQSESGSADLTSFQDPNTKFPQTGSVGPTEAPNTTVPEVTSSIDVKPVPTSEPVNGTETSPVVTGEPQTTDASVPTGSNTEAPTQITQTPIPTGDSTREPSGNTTEPATEPATEPSTESVTKPVDTASVSAPTGSPATQTDAETNGTATAEPTKPATDIETESAPASHGEQTSAVVPTEEPSVAPTSQPPVETETQAEPPTTLVPTAAVPVTSIRPTATLTNTNNWLPTTIIFEPTSVPAPPSQPTETSTSTGLPANIPRVILPNDPNKPIPEGSVAIQLGFLFPFNYKFLARNTVAAAQLFKYLPKGLADAGGFSQDRLLISKIVPLDTQAQWGYITALAKIHYPENMIDSLQADLITPNSPLYNNDLEIVRNLTSVINTKIDIFGDSDTENDSGSTTPDNSNGGNQDVFGNSGEGDKSAKQKATTAGIAVGAVGLSVMYGAAMFLVARRYKRKKQLGHRRASSIGSSQRSSEMQYTGNGSPALMGGALMSRDFSSYGATHPEQGPVRPGGRDSHGSGRSGMGNSARTAFISAPVAAENSLGWN
ncbi:Msb2 [Fusarium beomiforme]|uniref:Msb2 n=1 Tax=Fusarium beomiforme TaxID=44412 RepID=A0A9P5E517_9HYPO|nr:Msb2 [Fusarium beomiforme]